MSDASWKVFERRIARKLGTVRYSKSGLGHSVPDIIAQEIKLKEKVDLVIEAKLRKYIPKWILDYLEQIKNSRFSEDKLKMVIVKEKQKRDDDSLVIMRWVDFCDHFLDLGE